MRSSAHRGEPAETRHGDRGCRVALPNAAFPELTAPRRSGRGPRKRRAPAPATACAGGSTEHGRRRSGIDLASASPSCRVPSRQRRLEPLEAGIEQAFAGLDELASGETGPPPPTTIRRHAAMAPSYFRFDDPSRRRHPRDTQIRPRGRRRVDCGVAAGDVRFLEILEGVGLRPVINGISARGPL